MLIKCLFCNNVLDESDNFNVGEFVYCSRCDKDFEIVKLEPVKLKALGAYSQVGDDLSEDEEY
ncbi:MAG: hypothetical protein V1739_02885 [Candidatus Omnitrophota bacterium]